MKNARLKIGLITTLNHNIGDDFIREGIFYLLDSIFGRERIEYFPINKHKPLTIYPYTPIRVFSSLTSALFSNDSHWETSIYRKIGQFMPPNFKSHFDNCDAVIQCGTPVFWENCSASEWADIIWQKVVYKLHTHIPILNIAAGSSYPWERQPGSITDLRDAPFVDDILSYCALTTTRDTLASKIVRFLNYEAECLPCTAFLVGKNHFSPYIKKDLFIINFMPGGGHSSYHQEIDPMAWESTIKSILPALTKRHSVIFLCHNHREEKAAKKLAPSVPRVLPKSSHEYFSIASRGKAALCNRMHASVALAGIGIPSIAVGTDSRLLMVDRLGLPNYYVKDVTAEILEPILENLISSQKMEMDRLFALQDATVLAYRSLLSPTLAGLADKG